jgi:ABC-type microcin C transport system permease subunit YejB
MRVLALIINRMLWLVPTLVGLMIITFTISHIIPADPVAFFAGENATAEQIEALRARYGFDKPLHIQLSQLPNWCNSGRLGDKHLHSAANFRGSIGKIAGNYGIDFYGGLFFYDCRCSAWRLCRRLSKLFLRPFFESPYSLWACNC